MTKRDPRSVILSAGFRTAWNEGSRAGFIALGCLFLLLGVIGAFLPVMPTTVFLIGAAWAFGRSSPKLESWMLGHPQLGPPLVAWRTHGAIPRRAKYAACIGKALGFSVFLLVAHPAPWLAGIVFVILAAVALWIVRRPEPPSQSYIADNRAQPDSDDLPHRVVVSAGGTPCD